MEVSTEAVARPVEVPEVPAEPEKVVPEVAESDSTDDAPGKEKDPGGVRPRVGDFHGRLPAWKGRELQLPGRESVEVFWEEMWETRQFLIP